MIEALKKHGNVGIKQQFYLRNIKSIYSKMANGTCLVIIKGSLAFRNRVDVY